MFVVVRGQQISTVRYGLEDGLPSNQVYDVHQDSEGYLWFSTDRGVAKYDGYTFDIFTSKSGLSSNVILRIHEDEREKIWFQGIDGTLSYYDRKNKKLNQYAYNKVITDNNIPQIELLKIENNNLIFFTINGLYHLSPKGKLTKNQTELSFPFLCGYKKNVLVYHDNLTDTIPINTPLKTATRNLILYNSDKHFFFSIKNNLYSVKNKKIILKHTFEHIITGIEEIDENIVVSVLEEGIYKLSDGKPTLFFPHNNISKLLVTKDKQLWAATLYHGVMRIPYPFTYILSRESTEKVACGNGHLFFAKTNGKVYKYENHQSKLIYDLKNKPYTFDVFEDGLAFGGERHSSGYYYFNDGQIKTFKKRFGHIFFKDSLFFFSCSGSSLTASDHNYNYVAHINIPTPFSYYRNHKNDFLLGTLTGMYQFNYYKNSLKKISTHTRLDKEKINAICKINSTYILGTQYNGIALYNLADSSVKYITGLLSNQIKHLYHDKQTNTIWASTSKGLSKIENIDDDQKRHITHFTTSDGLPSNYVTMACIFKDTLWAATPKGLACFPKTQQKMYAKPLLYIDNIKIQGKDTALYHHYDLNYDENTITINFMGLSLKNETPVDYLYRLVTNSSDSAWTSTNERLVSFSSLSPGTYTFELKTKTNDGIESETHTTSFFIAPPFWRMWWFRGVFVLILAFIAYLFFYVNILSYNREVAKKLMITAIAKLRQQKKIEIKNVKDGSLTKVVISEILYIQADNKHVVFHLVNENKVEARASLKEIKQLLDKETDDFVQTHRSYLVNKTKIEAFHPTFVKIKDHKVPVGRAFRTKLILQKQ